MKMIRKNKQGAASFYVVAFSTLILLVVVSGFTALVVAQITRSSNEDLSQSAYDAALAGVEDAKLAFYNYQACVAQGATAQKPDNDYSPVKDNCGQIIWLMQNAFNDASDSSDANCDVVARILGRTIDQSGSVDIGVKVAENKSDNNMQEWYTCVKMRTDLMDYRATLTPNDPMKVVNVKFLGGGVAEKVKKMRVSWGSTQDNVKTKYLSKIGEFTDSNETSINPPVLGVALVQAEKFFKMEEFNASKDGHTNRGLVYLQPSKNGGNKVDASVMVKSNDKTIKNTAQEIKCGNKDSEFECSADIMLPDPIDSDGKDGAKRSDSNFMVAVMLPYGGATDFSLEFFCEEDDHCATGEVVKTETDTGEEKEMQVRLSGLQVMIDSTGRANDLFRRVEARLEGSDSFAISLMGPLELFGGEGSGSSSEDKMPLVKDLAITCEWTEEFGKTGGACLEEP